MEYHPKLRYRCRISSDTFGGYQTIVSIEPEVLCPKRAIIEQVVLNLSKDLYQLGLETLANEAQKTNFCIHDLSSKDKLVYVCECTH